MIHGTHLYVIHIRSHFEITALMASACSPCRRYTFVCVQYVWNIPRTCLHVQRDIFPFMFDMTLSTAPSLRIAGADVYVIELTMYAHLSVCADNIVTPSLAHLRLTVSHVLSLACEPSLSLLLSLHLLSPSIRPLCTSCVRANSLFRLLFRFARHFSLPLSFFLSLSCTAHT